MNDYCLAIIGAGQAAVPIIEKAKQLSIKVLAFARQGSYAQDMVDIFIEENSFDINFMAEKCREYEVNGIMATSESTTEVAAKLAHKLSLPGNDVENGFAGKNKYVMRSRVSALTTVSQPAYELYRPGREYTYPVVIKPTDACGKRGVSIAFDESELLPLVDVAAANSTNGEVLVEEYLAGGKEYSIECLSFAGKHQVVQYTEKESSGPPHFVETAHHQPADLSDEIEQRIRLAVDDILFVLGLNCGMAHLELKIIDGKLFFIEVGARGGGDHIADVLTVNSTDFDYYKAAIECALGTYIRSDPHTVACTGIYFHCFQNKHLNKLFMAAEKKAWCIANTVRSSVFPEAETNIETSDSGYIIYRSDHRIGLKDCADSFSAQIINQFPDAKMMLRQYCNTIESTLSAAEFEEWFGKINNTGSLIAIIDNQMIVAFSLLYCNHKDTLDAYLCNVHVLNKYRGIGLSFCLLEKAVDVCRQNGFKSISLDVDKDNDRAIYVYKKFGFFQFDSIKQQDNRISMRYFLG